MLLKNYIDRHQPISWGKTTLKNGEDVNILLACYEDRHLAIIAICTDGMIWGNLTVNVSDRNNKDYIFIYDYIENNENNNGKKGYIQTLIDVDLIKEQSTYPTIKSGYVKIPYAKPSNSLLKLLKEFNLI